MRHKDKEAENIYELTFFKVLFQPFRLLPATGDTVDSLNVQSPLLDLCDAFLYYKWGSAASSCLHEDRKIRAKHLSDMTELGLTVCYHTLRTTFMRN